jgi:type II secretory pathway predicted ATPase ExeA
MGKTTLLNKLMEDLRDSARTVFLFQTQCNSRELLRYLLGELGVKHAGMDAVAMHRALNEILFQEMLHGRRFVLIVDEAQNLDESVLETIRLLSDFETSHRKLIQILLSGQPQLVDTLMRPSLVQLRQRIAIVANLESLSPAETSRYVDHRLRAAGSSGEPIFTQEALGRIAELSHGTPRRINNLCFNALVSGYAQGTKTIDLEIVQKVAAKLDLSSLRRPRRGRAGAQRTHRVIPSISAELSSALVTALTRGRQSDSGEVSAAQSKTGITLTGKLTEKLRSRSWGKENEFRIQVSLERESSSDIPVADRYYCCSFYISEEQAAVLRVGQAIKIKIQ